MVNDMVARLAAVTVLDTAGNSIQLGTLWDERPIVLAMIRHFG